MKLQITCIWISLLALIGTSQTGYAAESMEPQPKETIALIGTGDFGNSFGPRLAALGYPIVYGSRNPESDKVKALLKKTGHGATATTQKDAAQQGDIVMLLLPWPAMETITQNLGDMSGKVLIDVSWPPVEITDDGYYRLLLVESISNRTLLAAHNLQSHPRQASRVVLSPVLIEFQVPQDVS